MTIEIKEMWLLQNEQHCLAISKCRQLNLVEPEFHECWLNHMTSWYEGEIMRAKTAYYAEGEPIYSDMAYDKIEEILRRLKPDSMVLSKVGYELEKTDE